MSTTRIAPAALALLVLLASLRARAQDENADTLVAQGIAFRRAGDDAGALTVFARAWEVGHAPRARAQMGLAEQALGRWVDAFRHLQEALDATGDAWVTAHRGTLLDSLEASRGHVARLELLGGAPGAHVRVNGTDEGTLPLSVPVVVEAGSVVVQVTADGFFPLERTFSIPAGTFSRETLNLVPRATGEPETHDAPPAPIVGDAHGADLAPAGPAAHHEAPRPRPREDGGGLLRALGVVGLSVGAAASVGGLIALVVRNDAATTFDSDACVPPGRTRGETCPSQLSTAHTAEDWMIAGFVTSGVLVTAGLVALVVGLGASSERPPQVACGPGPGDVGVACGGAL